jgi:hypothetical protein
MNDHKLVADQLRERRKGKPGELLLMTGVVLMIAAPFALVLTNQNGEKLAVLKAQGMVSQATVKAKAVRSESYTDRKGRPKSRDHHSLDLAHDINAELKYADWQAGKPFARPQYPAVTTTSIEVGESYYDNLAAGRKITVVRIPSDYGSMMLTEQLEYETSLAYRMWWYLGAGAAVLAGFVMTVMGWRKRFPRG